LLTPQPEHRCIEWRGVVLVARVFRVVFHLDHVISYLIVKQHCQPKLTNAFYQIDFWDFSVWRE